MSLREVGWLLFLAGLPFSFLLNHKLDIWHMQTLWAQTWIVILTAFQWAKGWRLTAPNKPLAAFIAWAGLWTLWTWQASIVQTNKYPLDLLMPITHLWLLVLCYHLMVSSWNRRTIQLVLSALAWTCLISVLYGYLQWANLDQFFTHLGGGRDVIVGPTGNQSHFSAFLAFSLFIFLYKGKWWYGAVALTIGLLALTHSMAGLLAAAAGITVWVWHLHRKYVYWLLALGASLVLYALGPHELDPHGRLMVWGEFGKMFVQKPITGWGPGFIMLFSQTVTKGPLFTWRHVHNEYFQYAIEYGLIGFAFILWGIQRTIQLFCQMSKTKEAVVLAAIGTAFLVNASLNFPSHLWVLGMFGLIAYAGLDVLAEQEVL